MTDQVALHAPMTRLSELDGLRGILAMFVVVYHLIAPLTVLHEAVDRHFPLLEQAWYAVDIFFLMSGFVMAYVYSRTFAGGAKAADVFGFLKARLARIYPIHLLTLLALLPILYISRNDAALFAPDGRYSGLAFAANALLLHSPWLDHRTWNFPSWSISAEWHAYLAFPFLAPLIPRLKTLGLGLITLLGVLVPLGIYVFGLASETYPTNGLIVLARVIPLFVAGMAVFQLYIHHAPFFTKTWLGAAVLVVSLGCLLTPMSAPYAVLLSPLVLGCSLGVPFMKRVLASPLCVYLGKISYSIYMIHGVVVLLFEALAIRVAQRLLHMDPTQSPGLAVMVLIVCTALSLVLAHLAWRYFEKPSREWVMNLGRGRAK